MGEWQQLPFSSAVLVNPTTQLSRGRDYPFVAMGALTPGLRCVYSSERRNFEGGGSRFRHGDTLMARITPCLENGKIARYCGDDREPAHGSTEFIVIRGREGLSDTAFAYYLTKWGGVSGYAIAQMMGTSGRQRVPATALDYLVVAVPPLVEQRAIAHILGTLDDKIELNRRMIETLEAMARALFKSWFVDFDPVRAKMEGRDTGLPKHLADLFPDRLVDSELGEIPEGWGAKKVSTLCQSIMSGGTPHRMNTAFWHKGTIPWYKTGELHDGPVIDSEEQITEEALRNSSCKLWPAGTVLFALYAAPTLGSLGVLTRPGTSNQAAAGLIAKPEHGVPFLRRVLLEARPKLQAIAVGAAQQNINQVVLKEHQVVVPANGLSGLYSHAMAFLDERQVRIAEESRTLTALRDALLPKLISGRLRVEDAESILRGVP